MTEVADAKLQTLHTNPAPSLEIKVRKSADRGHARPTKWLNSYHTFSFANYYDPAFDGFHTLRVLNEDRVAPSQGFGAHGHDNFEIFSYVVSGTLHHRDSLRNNEYLTRGAVQFTSAGTGIRHSEMNGSDSEMVHFLQMWVEPSKEGLKPNYQTKHFSDAEKLNKLRVFSF